MSWAPPTGEPADIEDPNERAEPMLSVTWPDRAYEQRFWDGLLRDNLNGLLVELTLLDGARFDFVLTRITENAAGLIVLCGEHRQYRRLSTDSRLIGLRFIEAVTVKHVYIY